jgi:hypothetical protein
MELQSLKKELAELLKKHPTVDEKLTGKVEINFNEGGITKIYVNTELK